MFVTLMVVIKDGKRRITGRVSGRVSDPQPGQSRRQNISRAAQAYVEATEESVYAVRDWVAEAAEGADKTVE